MPDPPATTTTREAPSICMELKELACVQNPSTSTRMAAQASSFGRECGPLGLQPDGLRTRPQVLGVDGENDLL